MIASTMLLELSGVDRSALVKWHADVLDGRLQSVAADSIIVNNDASIAPTQSDLEEIDYEVRAAARRALNAKRDDVARMRQLGYPRRGSKFFGRIRGRR